MRMSFVSVIRDRQRVVDGRRENLPPATVLDYSPFPLFEANSRRHFYVSSFSKEYDPIHFCVRAACR